MKIWKFVFWLVTFFFVFGLLSTPFEDNLEFGDFIDLVASGISLMPLYGFAYQLPIGNKGISIAIFIFNLFWAFKFVFYCINIFVQEPNPGMFAMLVFTLIINAACVYPQYMYTFKSNNLWANNA